MAYRTYRPRRARTRKGRAASPLVVLVLLVVAAVTGWLLNTPEAADADYGGASAFACASPYVHDGDNIRCQGGPNSRLYGIDAPEMKGACRPGRECTPGDPIAARDHLRELVTRGPVECQQLDTDKYQRPILRCTAGGVDLSCAQVDTGHAVERYGRLAC